MLLYVQVWLHFVYVDFLFYSSIIYVDLLRCYFAFDIILLYIVVYLKINDDDFEKLTAPM